MAKINWGRVVLGGFLNAVVFNAIWTSAWLLFLRSGWTSALEALGRTFPETPGAAAFWLLLTLVGGIFAIWFYAAIRPRYGPGPKTAACAGFALWLIGWLAPSLWWARILLLPTGLVASSAVMALVGIVAAMVLGAWPYKEE